MAELVDALDSKSSSEESVGSSPTGGTKIKEAMDTKILNKITQNVRYRTKILRDGKKEYLVERKSSDDSGWDVITKTTKLERALIRKHNAWLAQLSRLSYTTRLLRRRKYGKQKLMGININ